MATKDKIKKLPYSIPNAWVTKQKKTEDFPSCLLILCTHLIVMSIFMSFYKQKWANAHFSQSNLNYCYKLQINDSLHLLFY